MRELTDDYISKIEQLLDIELLGHQKIMLKYFWAMRMNVSEDEFWKAHYFGRPIQVIDCNNCAWLNMTEAEQMVKGYGNHICEYYHKRVIHRNREHLRDDGRLYPCDECYKDGHQKFSRKQNHHGLSSNVTIIDEFAGKED